MQSLKNLGAKIKKIPASYWIIFVLISIVIVVGILGTVGYFTGFLSKIPLIGKYFVAKPEGYLNAGRLSWNTGADGTNRADAVNNVIYNQGQAHGRGCAFSQAGCSPNAKLHKMAKKNHAMNSGGLTKSMSYPRRPSKISGGAGSGNPKYVQKEGYSAMAGSPFARLPQSTPGDHNNPSISRDYINEHTSQAWAQLQKPSTAIAWEKNFGISLRGMKAHAKSHTNSDSINRKISNVVSRGGMGLNRRSTFGGRHQFGARPDM